MRSFYRRTVQCERCGQQVATRAARWWGDEDYAELLQEYFAMERRARQAEARVQWAKDDAAWWREQHGLMLDQALTLSTLLLEQAKEAEKI